MRTLGRAVPAALALLVAGSVQAVTPAQKCESGKSKLAGQYDYRRQKAEAKSATTGDGAARTAGGASRAAHDDYAPCAGIR